MHDNGLIDLSNGGRGPTPIQKHVYFRAKEYWTEREKEKSKRKMDSKTKQMSKGY